MRFSLTLATLANNDGASSAASLGSSAPDSFNTYGDEVMASVQSVLGFSGASTWPSYLTVDLMTMDYGSPSQGVCVVAGGECQMGQSALQAAYNLHDHWLVPYANIELTPMIGQNDASQRAVLPERRGHRCTVRDRPGARRHPFLVVRPRHRLRRGLGVRHVQLDGYQLRRRGRLPEALPRRRPERYKGMTVTTAIPQATSPVSSRSGTTCMR